MVKILGLRRRGGTPGDSHRRGLGTPGPGPRGGGVSGRGVGEEIGQRGRGAGRQRRGRVGRKAEVAQDFAQHVGRLDRGDDRHAAAAAGAFQNVEIENPPHQVRPLPVSGLLGRIRLLPVARMLGGGGARDVGSRRGRVGASGFRGGGGRSPGDGAAAPCATARARARARGARMPCYAERPIMRSPPSPKAFSLDCLWP